jgi:F-type H+-transporting ATPase subunit gamma
MASLKALRLRIKSIKSTQKITKAMQMVAASKLRRSKEALEDGAIYHDLVAETLHRLPRSLDDPSKLEKLVLSGNDKPSKILAIVVTSERGLCGGFNASVLRYVRSEIDQMKADGLDVKIVTIGKKGLPFMTQRYGSDLIAHFANPSTADLKAVADLDKEIKTLIESGFDSCKIYFSHFKNAMTQIPQAKTVIPAEAHTDMQPQNLYEFEGEGLADTVIGMYISSEVYYALLESKASEEAARMVAMDSATKNAGDMIQRLTLSMNRSRQATITKELIEIISGAEAV